PGQLVRWNITPLAAEWLAGASNNGVALKAEQALGLATFYSSEESAQAKRPTLTLTYQIPCGGPSVALGFKDTTTNNPISDGKTGVPVKLEIVLSNPTSSAANLTAGLTIALSPVLDPVFSTTLTTPTGITVSNPVAKSLTGCGSMTFNPAAGASSITLSGGSIPAAVGSTPGVCVATVWVTPSAVSGKVPGTYPNASYPNGAATSLIAAANSLQTSAGNNVQATSASIFVTPTLTADTFLDHANGTADNYNFGADGLLKAQNNNAKSKQSLLQFTNLGIPTSSTVQSAKLRLYVSAINSRSSPTVNLTLAVNRLTSAWTEGAGTIALPSANGATYKHKTTSTNWTTNGGDFDATTANYIIPGTFATGWIEIPVTALVQSWVNGSFANNGFIIRVTSPTTALVDEVVFESRQSGLGASFAPQLMVTYQ
ncbi:MAG: DNRLRE domain-containing protein, partial [Burkholderiales bacterium]